MRDHDHDSDPNKSGTTNFNMESMGRRALAAGWYDKNFEWNDKWMATREPYITEKVATISIVWYEHAATRHTMQSEGIVRAWRYFIYFIVILIYAIINYCKTFKWPTITLKKSSVQFHQVSK